MGDLQENGIEEEARRLLKTTRLLDRGHGTFAGAGVFPWQERQRSAGVSTQGRGSGCLWPLCAWQHGWRDEYRREVPQLCQVRQPMVPLLHEGPRRRFLAHELDLLQCQRQYVQQASPGFSQCTGPSQRLGHFWSLSRRRPLARD